MSLAGPAIDSVFHGAARAAGSGHRVGITDASGSGSGASAGSLPFPENRAAAVTAVLAAAGAAAGAAALPAAPPAAPLTVLCLLWRWHYTAL